MLYLQGLRKAGLGIDDASLAEGPTRSPPSKPILKSVVLGSGHGNLEAENLGDGSEFGGSALGGEAESVLLHNAQKFVVPSTVAAGPNYLCVAGVRPKVAKHVAGAGKEHIASIPNADAKVALPDGGSARKTPEPNSRAGRINPSVVHLKGRGEFVAQFGVKSACGKGQGRYKVWVEHAKAFLLPRSR
jgi:hypothetical protein